MDLQVNSSRSATDYTEKESKYSLKKRKLQQWIYLNHLTQPYVARRLGLDPIEFKGMIKDNVPFNRKQITRLVRLMGAKDAFRVIYFPSREQRTEVYQKVFGNEKERKNE